MNAPVGPSEKISPLDRYRLFRSRIEHEDNLIMQRFAWLMASQSFLFTAYAIVTNGLTNPPRTNDAIPYVSHLLILAHIVPVVALLNSLFIFFTIAGALKAIRELRDAYRLQPGIEEILPLQTSRVARRLGLSAPILLPLLFLVVWVFLLMY